LPAPNNKDPLIEPAKTETELKIPPVEQEPTELEEDSEKAKEEENRKN